MAAGSTTLEDIAEAKHAAYSGMVSTNDILFAKALLILADKLDGDNSLAKAGLIRNFIDQTTVGSTVPPEPE